MKHFITSLFLIVPVAALCQEYRKFNVGVGGGYIEGTGLSAIFRGPLAYVEPSYRITNRISLGLKMEVVKEIHPEYVVKTVTSYTINTQYYFRKKDFQPFIGLGGGIYTSMADYKYYPEQSQYPASAGFYPRIGFRYRHLTYTVDYNITKAQEWIDPFDDTFTLGPNGKIAPEIRYIKTDYFSMKIGVLIGGGKKKV